MSLSTPHLQHTFNDIIYRLRQISYILLSENEVNYWHFAPPSLSGEILHRLDLGF
jgi:hypothetical protein